MGEIGRLKAVRQKPRKWQLIGTGCSTAAQASGCPLPTLTDVGPAVMQLGRHTTPQLTTLGLHPVIDVPNYMDKSRTFSNSNGFIFCLFLKLL